MTDFLTRLAERSLGVGEVVSPRPVSVFEPRSPVEASPFAEEWVEVDAEPPVPMAERKPVRKSEPPPAPPAARSDSPAVPSQEETAPEPAPRKEQPPEPLAEPEPAPPLHNPEVDVERLVPMERADRPPPEREPAPVQPAAAAKSPVPEPRAPSAREASPAPTPSTVVVHQRERLVTPRRSAPEPSSDPEPQGEPVGFLHTAAPESLLSVELPPRPAPTTREEPPIIHVTIGRVDVRAVVPDMPAERPAPRLRPRMTLDEYLGKDGRR